MAFGRFNPDMGGKGGSPGGFQNKASFAQRGSFGSEQNPSATAGGGDMLSSSLPGNPHSSSGFRRALERTQRTSGRLKDQMPDKTSFAGKGYNKPNYFAQGGKRHGMHIGAGSPFTGAAQDTGADFGG